MSADHERLPDGERGLLKTFDIIARELELDLPDWPEPAGAASKDCSKTKLLRVLLAMLGLVALSLTVLLAILYLFCFLVAVFVTPLDLHM